MNTPLAWYIVGVISMLGATPFLFLLDGELRMFAYIFFLIAIYAAYRGRMCPRETKQLFSSSQNESNNEIHIQERSPKMNSQYFFGIAASLFVVGLIILILSAGWSGLFTFLLWGIGIGCFIIGLMRVKNEKNSMWINIILVIIVLVFSFFLWKYFMPHKVQVEPIEMKKIDSRGNLVPL